MKRINISLMILTVQTNAHTILTTVSLYCSIKSRPHWRRSRQKVGVDFNFDASMDEPLHRYTSTYRQRNQSINQSFICS